jgi:hypothetical protein
MKSGFIYDYLGVHLEKDDHVFKDLLNFEL